MPLRPLSPRSPCRPLASSSGRTAPPSRGRARETPPLWTLLMPPCPIRLCQPVALRWPLGPQGRVGHQAERGSCLLTLPLARADTIETKSAITNLGDGALVSAIGVEWCSRWQWQVAHGALERRESRPPSGWARSQSRGGQRSMQRPAYRELRAYCGNPSAALAHWFPDRTTPTALAQAMLSGPACRRSIPGL